MNESTIFDVLKRCSFGCLLFTFFYDFAHKIPIHFSNLNNNKSVCDQWTAERNSKSSGHCSCETRKQPIRFNLSRKRAQHDKLLCLLPFKKADNYWWWWLNYEFTRIPKNQFTFVSPIGNVRKAVELLHHHHRMQINYEHPANNKLMKLMDVFAKALRRFNLFSQRRIH